MKLSEYCKTVENYIDTSVQQINEQGDIKAYFNNKVYEDPVEFLDDAVASIVDYVMQGDIEKDISFAEAFVEAGIVQHYLKYTPVLSKVVYTNPLGFLKR